ncbi:DUF5819 family protein [Gulosibacter molinativorax]|uniref:Uncharacterized protein n=1 Tax=Gulosibacter molinativorax TaxID=256821 RepID=A0ABT7C6G7_9MICO|nr:DUF5819 family protein [Gulosibacter molinativorax]MDJ1370780.1 hypothetical protein [Gulosibacter molinativorax]QUY63191.1 Unknown protein [Gulosibacter molinativorax]
MDKEKKKRSHLVRGVLVALSLVTAWHIFASFLWIAPSSPLREIPTQKVLSSYMIPFFGQSWSVFAPEPINGSYTLKVRAVVDDGSGPVETEWVDATAVEYSMIQNNLFPPRAGIQAGEVASQHKAEFDGLTADHQVIAGLNYFEGDWEARLEEKMSSYGDAALVEEYMVTEHMATAYATQVARAVWGEDVQRVQYEISRQNVIPFADHHDPEAQQPPVQIIATGWRGLIVNPGQSDEAFADVFLRVYEGMQ